MPHLKITFALNKFLLKKAKAVIDMANDKITVLIINYIFPLVDIITSIFIQPKQRKKIRRRYWFEKRPHPIKKENQKIIKIHTQFRHALVDSIKKLINNTGLLHKCSCNITENVVQSCDNCIRFKQVPPRPEVGFAKAKDFNETVSIDLH